MPLPISRSTVQFCPLAQYNTMGYGLGRSPLLPLGSIWGSVFDGLDALSLVSGGARLQWWGFLYEQETGRKPRLGTAPLYSQHI